MDDARIQASSGYLTFIEDGEQRRHITLAALIELSSVRCQFDRLDNRGMSFSGLLTRVEIGHIRIRGAVCCSGVDCGDHNARSISLVVDLGPV
jgi:hypothetical protein